MTASPAPAIIEMLPVTAASRSVLEECGNLLDLKPEVKSLTIVMPFGAANAVILKCTRGKDSPHASILIDTGGKKT